MTDWEDWGSDGEEEWEETKCEGCGNLDEDCKCVVDTCNHCKLSYCNCQKCFRCSETFRKCVCEKCTTCAKYLFGFSEDVHEIKSEDFAGRLCSCDFCGKCLLRECICEDCSICMDKLRGELHTGKCVHKFHKRCADSWKKFQEAKNLHARCPLCRDPGF